MLCVRQKAENSRPALEPHRPSKSISIGRFLLTAMLALVWLSGSGAQAGELEEGHRAVGRKDYKQALAHYQQAAANGSYEAELHIGLLYYHGQGMPVDTAEGLNWIKRSAGHGFPTAKKYIGDFFLTGAAGFPKDEWQAMYWYRLAAEKGHSTIAIEIGDRFRDGKDVARDPVEAAKWYRLGSAKKDSGSDAARGKLGFLYLEGQGFPRDNVFAYMWFNLGPSMGTDARDIVAKRMSSAEITEAQRLSRQCIGRDFFECDQ